MKGDQKIHISVDMDPTPFLDFIIPPGDPRPVSAEFREINNDPSKTDEVTGELTMMNLGTTRRVLLDEINSAQELCDIHTALCPLVSRTSVKYILVPKSRA